MLASFLKSHLFTLLLASLSLINTQAFASNRYYADNTLQPKSGFAWDWGVGADYYIEDSYLVGMNSYDVGFEPDIHVALSYKRFYLDFDQSQLSGGIVLGYSLINESDWGLDILGTNMQAGFTETGLGFYDGDVIPELAGIKNRHYDFDMGIRLSRRFENSQISFEYLQDVSGTHNGWIINSFFSQIVAWRNWEFRSGVGLSSYSADFTQYYFGIDEQEATALRPIYQPDVSYSVIFEFHAEYPLNQNWVFLTGWLSTWFSDDISNSPIISQDYQHKAKVGVRYVF